MKGDVWCIPLGRDQALIYAPYHGITTLVNRSMSELVFRCLAEPGQPVPTGADWINVLRQPGKHPSRHCGPVSPLYLGLIPTRSCMMQCAYCDFVSAKNSQAMSYDMIRHVIDGYADILRGRFGAEWNMHFFGGEPFAAFGHVVFAVNYARRKADELGIPTHFEVTTNGYYSEERCRWIAENIDTVVLSLDGFPKTQNLHRPGPGGQESFPTVCRNADIFACGSCELIIRSCVSALNADGLPGWAAFVAHRWYPDAVCLEPMIESGLARKNGLSAPDASLFARNWAAACRILRAEKIRPVYSSGDVSALRNSICGMGQDALIVSPDGRIGGCWQLAEMQHDSGIDLHFGVISDEKLCINDEALENQRRLSEENRERCRGCFCYAHCAGGCVLKQENNSEFCRMTKSLTLWQLLEKMGYGELADTLLNDQSFMDHLASQKDFGPDTTAFPENDVCPVQKEQPVAQSFSARNLDKLFQFPPRDAERGWIREGNTIILMDPQMGMIERLEGRDALFFQIEHAGMTSAEIETVRKELIGETF